MAECAVISSVVDTGTNGVWCVDPYYLNDPDNYYTTCGCTAAPESCYCGSGSSYNSECFKNGSFTYSSDYDSTISTWTSSALADGIWLHGFWRWDWNDEVYKVLSIDTVNRVITVNSKNSNYGIQNYTLCDESGNVDAQGTFLANPSPRRWFAMNILEELTSAGEYYIDRVNKKLYFWTTRNFNFRIKDRIYS